MNDPQVLARMREDWNRRADEDANYYVAFGRREQDDDEFFATASDLVRALEGELKRVRGRERALEIGCGPGRVMRPMARNFGEIHGVDVSDEMIRLATDRLRDTPNAHPHRGSGADLSLFADDWFDFAYSFAVFQHIPSREVVFNYLREAWRVLKPGGVLRCQINGLPEHAQRYDTWSGVRISAEELHAFTLEQDFQLLALEQIWTQYMWMTCRKAPHGWREGLGRAGASKATIRNISNALTGEAVAPASGGMAALSLWVEELPAEIDLNHMEVTANRVRCRGVYIGEPAADGVAQVNVVLPEGLRTGLVPVELRWLGRPLCAPQWVRITPPVPLAPRVLSVADGINLVSGDRIHSGIVKLVMVEVGDPGLFRASIDGVETKVDHFCIDPVWRTYEFNIQLPEGLALGRRDMQISLGRRALAPVSIEVA